MDNYEENQYGDQSQAGGSDERYVTGYDTQTGAPIYSDGTRGNVYRFANTEAVRPKKKKVKKAKKGWTMPKVAIAAVMFGVIASGCFFGVNAGLNAITGKSHEKPPIESAQSGPNSDSDTIEQTKPGLTTESGQSKAISDVSDVVEEVMPSIVSITEKYTAASYFGQQYSAEAAGSGFIVKQDDDQLLIATNNHVVAKGEEITVTFNDGESAPAIVKGTSTSNDLAVITVDMKDLKDSTKKAIKVATLGSSDDAKVGEMVIAIGNAAGVGQSVTVGYLSAKEREFTASDEDGNTVTMKMLQTDAAINPGNSGGVLIDTSGRVIGINSSKMLSTQDGTTIEGMGYAIPISSAVSVINDLMDREVLKDEEKGYLGISGQEVTETEEETYGIPQGVYVKFVSDTGAAAKAGIRQGDVITAIDGTSVSKVKDIQEIVNSKRVGTTIEVTVQRSNGSKYEEQKIKVTLQSKDTLDGLPQDNTDDQNSDQEQPQQDQGNNDSDGWGDDDFDGSQIIPWGFGW